MLPFLRSDLSELVAYSSEGHESHAAEFDKLDTNEFPLDLPEALKEKLAFLSAQQIQSNRYPDASYVGLRQEIARYVSESADAVVTPEQISVGNGSDELIRSILIATCLNHAGSILVAEPTFSMYAILARSLGIPVVSVPRHENFEIDIAAAQSALAQHPEIRVVFLVHPNSPTGNALTEAELTWAKALPPEILVVVDEAYYEFSGQTTVAELSRSNWMILRTFSKAFRLAAHRLGYAIAQPELALALEKIRLPYNLPSVSQAAACLALTHRKELLAEVKSLRQEREQLYQVLLTHSDLRVWPSAANFLFIKTLGSRSAAELHQGLQQQGTLVRQTCGGLRITVGTAEENQRTLARLRQVL
ncbi:histidinol-phosphate transaminase [Leptolyngbya sp. FACHB-261]|uniref:histidinol-phosphate transaminase n=1 Tax=Leptolyngbya sp. FACHB-261 TaxID=2692806 RepID=UPI001684D320|nr:histidinol-phosphate transaminase [Leptolyngbya sp. FACHB-261]MBD2102151.1 histidinol-phosphate transaminase [Leptolyngbya sp. FACHB-261]